MRAFDHFQAMQFDFDVAILGGGSAGYAAARTTSSAGLKTVVIEGGEEIGGLCILRGCMPTKALLYMAEVAHLVKNSKTFGVRAGKISFDFKKAMARKNVLIKDFADYRVKQLNSGKFKFIRANAKFLDAHTIELNSPHSAFGHPLPAKRGEGRGEGHPKKITAKNFVISTGSIVAPSPLPQLNEVGYITSDDALALKKLPKSLVVLGGGPTACEFAQFFSRFGVKVTLIQRSPHILHDFDADVSAVVEKVFRREGIKVFTGTKLLDAKRKEKLKTISFEQNGKKISVSAEEILFALGRIPNTANLNLENAGVKTERGGILCNEFMQTSAPHIFAGGDCAGPFEIVHIAVTQGEIAGKNIVESNKAGQASSLSDFSSNKFAAKMDRQDACPTIFTRADYRLLISVVFTEPQLAFVGLTEKEANARGVKFISASYPFDDHGKSLIMEAKDGFVKLLANPKTGEILGGSCVGPSGGELIHEIAAAMSKRMTVHELATMPHYHPTLAEIWTYPAEELAERILPARSQ